MTDETQTETPAKQKNPNRKRISYLTQRIKDLREELSKLQQERKELKTAGPVAEDDDQED